LENTIGLNQEQLQMGLASDDAVRHWTNKERHNKRNKYSKEWARGVSNVQKTLMNWKKEIELLQRAIANFISRLFGFKDAAQATMPVVDVIKSAMGHLTNAINDLDPAPLIDLVPVFKDLSLGLQIY